MRILIYGVPHLWRVGLSVTSPRVPDKDRERCGLFTSIPHAPSAYLRVSMPFALQHYSATRSEVVKYPFGTTQLPLA